MDNSGLYKSMIQSINVSKDLGREELFELGKRGPYHKYINFPVELTHNNMPRKRIKFGEFVVTDEHRKAVNDCLDSGWLTTGDRVKQLEQEFAALFDYKHSTLLSSGTAACTVAAMTLSETHGAEEQDEVIVPALSFIATANAVRFANLKVVPVDIRPNTLCINEDLIEAAITSRTKAIMVVGTMGMLPDLVRIRKICDKYNLQFILDACECYGAKFNGKFGLEYANIELSSHYLAHLLAFLEGGHLSTNDTQINDIAQSIKSHGRTPGSLHFQHHRWGGNFKNTDLSASIGLVQVKKFWEIFNKRKDNLKQLIDSVKPYKEAAWFTNELNGVDIAPHGMSITFKNRGIVANFKRYLDSLQIDHKRNFESLSQTECFKHLGYTTGSFPISEHVSNNGVHIGIHEYLTPDEVTYICDSLIKFFREI